MQNRLVNAKNCHRISCRKIPAVEPHPGVEILDALVQHNKDQIGKETTTSSSLLKDESIQLSVYRRAMCNESVMKAAAMTTWSDDI